MPWRFGTHVVVTVPSDLGRCLWVAGCFEPNELAWLSGVLRPGMTFVDIGANIGLYSLVAARLVGTGGTVIAFEPSPRERRSLAGNLERNAIASVAVRADALGASEGRAVLHVADEAHAGQNTLGGTIYPGVSIVGEVEVRVTTLDAALAREGVERCDVVKLDVEGAEALVLAGAGEVLAGHRPLVLLELQEASLAAMGSGAAEVVGRLRSADYAVVPFAAATGRPDPARAADPVDELLGASPNVVAYPRERLGELGAGPTGG